MLRSDKVLPVPGHSFLMQPPTTGTSPRHLRTRFRTRVPVFGVVAGLLLISVSRAADALPILTHASDPWALPTELKSVEHPIRMEGRVSYFDPLWRQLWLEQDGLGSYLQLAESAPAMKIGQRVLIEGTIVANEGLSAKRARVTVLQEYEPVVPLETKGRLVDIKALHARIVVADAYVDRQQLTDVDHVRLALVIDDRPVICWFKPDNLKSIPNWEGKFVRIVGMYSARFDPTNTDATIELWAGPQSNISLTGTLDDQPGFAAELTPIGRMHQLPLGAPVHVRGRVQRHEPGSALVLRDASGQVDVHSPQLRRMPLGAEIEAAGVVGLNGSKWVLRSALHRKVAGTEVPASPALNRNEPLTRVDQIRELSLDDAGEARPVRMSGLVTWALPDTEFFFLQDVSGGIRVRYDRATLGAPVLGKYLEIEGVTFNSGYVPGVELKTMRDLGSMNPPAPRSITLEQAITGKEDGQWVEMRGFLQYTESEGDWRRIHVTTPSGEFIALLKSPVNVTANLGALIRVRGVCEAVTGPHGRMSGVMLRVPFLHSIATEEEAPLDHYDLPLRSIKSLRQLSAMRGMARVRIIGTVLHAVPGRLLYIQEGDTAVMLLTRQTDAPVPGTKVEAVGILGWEGARMVLRESMYQQISAGPSPAPLLLGDPSRIVPALDSRLVTVRGMLIDVARQQHHLRLTLQSEGALFEATLDPFTSEDTSTFTVGSGLELTGVYAVGFDDAREVRSFSLHLRSPRDVTVYLPPKLWTLQRALVVSGVLGGVTMLGIGWIAALRRRVRRQTQQIREQLERQSRLESEVQRSARLESLGELAGGIAHDFNNLLTIIIGNAGLASMDGKASPVAANCLREIERGAERARHLTRQLLTFAKGGEPVRAAVELPEVVRLATDLALHDTNVRCDYTMARDLRAVYADKDQISQVVHNVVRNAVQAMPNGGVLAVTLQNETVGEETKRGLPSGDYVKMTFVDSGEGIPADVLPKIFDPFFTTRKSGSGLGLATVYSIIKRHRGRIEAHSTPGIGTTFDVWLPVMAVAPQPVADVRRASGREASKLHTPRVLLMDDEPSIREIASAVLRRIGTEPVVVPDGGAALREFSLAQHNGAPFELVILDLTIPGGMGGKEAMELIRKLDADIPVIVSSGYSSDPVIANYVEYGFQAVVAKPYDVKEFAAVANRLLGRAT